MATVTGITFEKAMEILNGTINGADIVGGDLVFTLIGGGTLNVGSVQGPTGEDGPSGGLDESEVNALINTALGPKPRGCIALDKISTDFSWGFPTTAADTWTALTGVSITKTLVVGRTYRFSAGAVMNHDAANGAIIDMEIRDGSDPLHRGTIDTRDEGRGCGLSIVRDITAISGWGVSKTFALYVRANKATISTASGSYSDTFLSIEDLGIIS